MTSSCLSPQNLTMLRFPKSKICYLFPLVKRQSRPEKLIRDHKRAQKVCKNMISSNWWIGKYLSAKQDRADHLGVKIGLEDLSCKRENSSLSNISPLFLNSSFKTCWRVDNIPQKSKYDTSVKYSSWHLKREVFKFKGVWAVEFWGYHTVFRG